MIVALAVRPPEPHIAGVSITVILVVGVLVLVPASIFLRSFLKDRRAHDGVSSFKRNRVLRSGVAAEATILSSARLRETPSDVENMGYYSNVYEIPAPPGGEAFRTRGIELLPDDFEHYSGFASSILNLEPGEKVAVKYDPVTRTTVMVNRFAKLQKFEQMAAEREQAAERAQQQAAIALKEKQARLLRGDRE